MMKHVTIGLIGFGTVGSGTLELLRLHRRAIEERVGAPVRVAWVCSRGRKNSPLIPKGARQTTNWRDVVDDPAVDCVVELIGGLSPALSIVTRAIRNGKHVITANKAILAKHWADIFSLAGQNKRLVYFEAAVGGGVPIVQALNEGLAGNKIQRIVGILNGTTNYILTRMQEAGLTFADALAEAKKAGFAEADPTFDVEGVDAAQKISILASLAAGGWISPDRVHCEGISKLLPVDIRLIQERMHSKIKLLGIAEKTAKGWALRVHPTLIHESHPFANVRNEYNAVSLYGDSADDVMLYGKGAGRFPTSSAVISDVIFLCRQIANGTAGQLPYVTQSADGVVPVTDIANVRCRYYIRVTTSDTSGVLARVTGLLSRNGVSIATIHQDVYEDPHIRGGIPILFLTHRNLESNVQKAVRAIDRLASTTAKTVLLRME